MQSKPLLWKFAWDVVSTTSEQKIADDSINTKENEEITQQSSEDVNHEEHEDDKVGSKLNYESMNDVEIIEGEPDQQHKD